MSAPIGNPNTVAVLMIFGIAGAVAVLGFCIRRKEAWPLPGLGAIGILLLTLLAFRFAGSRSGLVGLGVAISVLLGLPVVRYLHARMPGSGLRWALPLAAAVLLGFMVLGGVYLSGEKKRAEIVAKVKLSSIGARVYGPVACWEMFKRRPLFGAVA